MSVTIVIACVAVFGLTVAFVTGLILLLTSRYGHSSLQTVDRRGRYISIAAFQAEDNGHSERNDHIDYEGNHNLQATREDTSIDPNLPIPSFILHPNLITVDYDKLFDLLGPTRKMVAPVAFLVDFDAIDVATDSGSESDWTDSDIEEGV
jgi:hypothetical protein